MADAIEVARRAFAEELRFVARIGSPRVVAAFATVPREKFLGPPPWRIKSAWSLHEYWTADENDPRALYHDVLVALDPERNLNNGQPSLWAFLIDRLGVPEGADVLHLGCGSGYYTAILAELVGPRGSVTGVEIDAKLAAMARAGLAPWPQARAVNRDGASGAFDPVDLIVASAGAAYPPPAWLAALRPGGRLLFPLTGGEGHGVMALLTRRSADRFAAKLRVGIAFYEFSGARDPKTSRRLTEALRADKGASVRSLRCDAHEAGETCWLHGEGWCFSREEAGED